LTERRTADDLYRMLADMQRRIEALERGAAGTVQVPASHPGGGAAAAAVVGVPFSVTGPVTARTLWTMPVVTLGASTVATLRVESAGSWTVTLGATKYIAGETTPTPVTHSTTGGWSGTLTLTNGGGTPMTAGVLWLQVTIGGADEVRIVTSGVTS
jgi:hypothetical protein